MSNILDMLVSETGLQDNDLRRIISNAPRRYKTFAIPKKNGGRRPISQPAIEIKVLQRVLLRNLLETMPVHSAATAYRPGLSIKENALRHASNGPIIKFDFKNFFPSLVSTDWHVFCSSHNLFDNPEDIHITTNILFHRPRGTSVLNLAIGAPSSPHLSNVLLHEFDTRVESMLKGNKVVYTRYADDLTFSAKRTGFLKDIERMLREVLKVLHSPRLSLNDDKTVTTTKKYRRVITGLVITNNGKVSIGHERKKIIRAAVHQALSGVPDEAHRQKLAGYLGFVRDIEPDFFQSLELKYGYEALRNIAKGLLQTRVSTDALDLDQSDL